MSDMNDGWVERVKALRVSSLPARFPLGLPVQDCEGRKGVVVGHQEGKVLVEATFVEEGQAPILRHTAMSPEHIVPVHPRPSRYELLAAVEGVLLRATASGTFTDPCAKARAILDLAQARALICS